MKKSVLFLFAAVVITGAISLLSSCGKEVTTTYNVQNRELCIVAQPFASATGFTQTDTIKQADLQAAFTAASITYTESRITSMVAKGFKLTVSGATTNLDGLAGAQVYIKKQGTSGDGEMIASTSASPAAGATTIDLNYNGTNLKSLLGTESLIITLRAYNKDSSPAMCIKLTQGVVNFELKK